MTIIKIIAFTLCVFCVIWAITNGINHELIKENMALKKHSNNLINACDAFMDILLLIKKTLNYTKFKSCPQEEIYNIIDTTIKMIDETERTYKGDHNDIHK